MAINNINFKFTIMDIKKQETSINDKNAHLGISVVKQRFQCENCKWIGTEDEMIVEQGWGYDQQVCPKCRGVMFNNLHGETHCIK